MILLSPHSIFRLVLLTAVLTIGSTLAAKPGSRKSSKASVLLDPLPEFEETIQVQWHIIGDGRHGVLSTEKIDNTLLFLNSRFEDTGFSFTLQGVNDMATSMPPKQKRKKRTNNSDNQVEDAGDVDEEVKEKRKWFQRSLRDNQSGDKYRSRMISKLKLQNELSRNPDNDEKGAELAAKQDRSTLHIFSVSAAIEDSLTSTATGVSNEKKSTAKCYGVAMLPEAFESFPDAWKFDAVVLAYQAIPGVLEDEAVAAGGGESSTRKSSEKFTGGVLVHEVGSKKNPCIVLYLSFWLF